MLSDGIDPPPHAHKPLILGHMKKMKIGRLRIYYRQQCLLGCVFIEFVCCTHTMTVVVLVDMLSDTINSPGLSFITW